MPDQVGGLADCNPYSIPICVLHTPTILRSKTKDGKRKQGEDKKQRGRKGLFANKKAGWSIKICDGRQSVLQGKECECLSVSHI